MKELIGRVEGHNKKIAIVISRFNEKITKSLYLGAVETLKHSQVAEDNITIVWVPGAFEIPYITKKLANSGRFDAIICLGAVIRGETSHFDYVAGEAASGIAKISQQSDIPVIFGILTTDTAEQALERADVLAGNKGKYAAEAALEMADLTRQLSL